MTSTPPLLQRGQRVPNWALKDTAGESHTIWDYRQKSHLVVIFDPEADSKTTGRWSAAIQADQKQWDWLNVKFIIVGKDSKEIAPGVYSIDRYGMFINSYPLGHWGFDDLEREFIYNEARHC